MPLERPTLSEIRARQEADLLAALQADEFLEGSIAKALSDSQAGTANELYGYIKDFLVKQGNPLTAEGIFLDFHAETYGFNRLSASFALGNITFTGTNSTVIPAGTQVVGTNGITYRTKAAGTISGGDVDIQATALVPGATANLDAAKTLTLLSAIAGVNSTVTVASGGITGGVDQESDDTLRDRLLGFLRKRPQGGAVSDYELWVSENSGTGQTWVFENVTETNSVDVYFVTGDEDNLIPSDAKVAEVQDYIDDESRRPLTVTVYVRKPTLVTQDFTIVLTAEDNEDIDEVKTAVENNLKDLLRRERKPGGTLLISKVREAVSNAAGERDNSVTNPSADVDYDTGEIPELGTITWSS